MFADKPDSWEHEDRSAERTERHETERGAAGFGILRTRRRKLLLAKTSEIILNKMLLLETSEYFFVNFQAKQNN